MAQRAASSNRGGLGVLASLAALATLATNIILPAFPEIGRSMFVSTQDLGVTLSAFFIPFALGQLVVGPLSDRLGRKGLMLSGLVTLTIGSIICALAMRLEWLILGRVIQGIGACAPSVLARSIARDRFEGMALSRALSFIMVAMAAAPGFSPLAGGLVSSVAGWRSVFLLVAVLTVLIGLLYTACIGETHPRTARHKVSFTATFANYFQLLSDIRFIAPAMAVGLTSGGLMAFFAATPVILMDGLTLPPVELGYFFATTVFVVFAAGLVAPKLATRWGIPIITMAGSAISLAGGIALLSGSMGLFHFSISISVFLFGAGLLNPLGTAMALQPFGIQAGAASALLGFLQMGMATLAITTISGLDLPTYQSLGRVLAAGMGLALLCLLVLRRNPLSPDAKT
ncbi:multidrug effflux MFS transporter [Pandoraea communis]|uniref:multidrug effflux MFS transporter n=1 Tax=Pandoraea communis TaxID=2508297 RepID=UPI0025A52481|nr:multidrug effflux MFS transporter [Pandoraea communis]MDM8359664.1 multidrug effflux MFS transporter [Pandoraea communis]